MTSIILADDHPLMLSGLEALLKGTEFTILRAVTDGKSALEALRELRPNILVLDVRMPILSGLEVARQLRREGSVLGLVLVTAGLSDSEAAEAVDLGVRGIVFKEVAGELLLECLRTVACGGSWYQAGVLDRAAELRASGQPGFVALLRTLTQREHDVAQLVSDGFRNIEVADKLGVTEGTVKVHLHRIYEKLGVSNRTQLSVEVRLANP